MTERRSPTSARRLASSCACDASASRAIWTAAAPFAHEKAPTVRERSRATMRASRMQAFTPNTPRPQCALHPIGVVHWTREVHCPADGVTAASSERGSSRVSRTCHIALEGILVAAP